MSTYWLDVLDRAARTFCQTAAGVLAANAIGVLDVDWQAVASVSATAALASLMSSIGARGFGYDRTTASIVPDVGEIPSGKRGRA